MKVSTKKIGECKTLLEVELPQQAVQEKFAEVYTELKKQASVPGFRRGNVPQDLLEKHYGKTAKEEVAQRLISDSLKSVIREKNLDPISVPQIRDVRLDGQSTFLFRAEIETRPQVKLKNYKNLKLKRNKIELSEKDVKETLLRFQKMHAQLSRKSKPGSQKEAGAEPPKEMSLPPLDDNFARKVFNCESLAKLKELVREDLIRRNEARTKQDIRNQLLQQLLKSNLFSCPSSLIEEELKHLVDQAKLEQSLQSGEKEKNSPQEEKLKEQLKKEAERRVRLAFILSEIAHRENIQVSPEDLQNSLKAIEERAGKRINPEKNLLDNLRFQLRQEKTIAFLIKEANLVEA